MKSFFALAAALLLSVAPATAQITAELSFEQDQYLACESLVAVVRIVNFSGQTLTLGKDEDWLRFAVECDDDHVVNKSADPPVAEAFTLPSSARATRRVDLAPYFDLSRPGHYRVTATVKIPSLRQETTSAPQGVNIMMGTKLWEQEFGLPVTAGAEGAPTDFRKFALVQSQSRKQIRLYVRVTDQHETTVYRVLPIGPLISFGRPEAQVDKWGRLHVLFQTGARSFTYNVVRADGELLVRETHQYTRTRPSLGAGEDGKIKVVGGARVASPFDLPKPAPAESTPAAAGPGSKPPETPASRQTP